jgi:hypothetical protein
MALEIVSDSGVWIFGFLWHNGRKFFVPPFVLVDELRDVKKMWSGKIWCGLLRALVAIFVGKATAARILPGLLLGQIGSAAGLLGHQGGFCGCR